VGSDIPGRTFKFACRIVKLCQTLDSKPGVPRVLANQLLRSGTSVGANVEEAQAAQSKADFISKYSISCKEARETHYWLRLLAVTDVIPKARLKDLENECNELISILTSSIKTMREKNQ